MDADRLTENSINSAGDVKNPWQLALPSQEVVLPEDKEWREQKWPTQGLTKNGRSSLRIFKSVFLNL